MERATLLRFGGYAAGVILIIFGIATIAIGIAGKNTVEDELTQEKIVGSPDMSPEGIAPGIEEANLTVDAPDCDVAEEPITTGSDARCFAQYMRIHALESSGGLTYAEMGSMFPRSGGLYVFLSEAYGTVWGFLFGWTQVTPSGARSSSPFSSTTPANRPPAVSTFCTRASVRISHP